MARPIEPIRRGTPHSGPPAALHGNGLQTLDPHLVSVEVFVIPLGGDRYLVYAPIRRAAFVTNVPVVNLLADLKEGCYRSEADPDGQVLELLQRLEIVGAPATERPITEFAGPPRPSSLTLLLTTGCNLRCTYCYASAGDQPARVMPFQVAQRGIDFVAVNTVERNESHFEIAYHGGGEPTLNWDVLTGSLEYAQRRAKTLGLSCTAAVATNGVLRDDQVEWIVANLNGGLSVSFDGLPEVQDQNRRTASGRGSSRHVARTLRQLDKAGYDYGIRVTVTQKQIGRLADSVEYICANFRPTRILVEPVYQLGRWLDAPSAETGGFVDAYREAQIRAWAHGRQIEFSAARLDTLSNHFCGVTQDSFVLTPDGNVTACYEVFSEDHAMADAFFYGKPNAASGGYVFDPSKLQHLREQTVDRHGFCEGCFAKWHCAGDCYHKSLAAAGQGEFRGTNRCHITRELIKDQLLTRIATCGGLFWHEPPEEVISNHAP